MTLAPTKGSQRGAEQGDTSGADPSSGDDTQPVVRSAIRLRKARQRRRRATVVQGVLTVVFVVALVGLAFVGWRSSLKLTGGRDLEVTDPAAPGYVAEVKPTDADLLAITAEDGSLVTMLLVIGDGADEPTTVVPISAHLVLWQYEDAKPDHARNLFASGGIDVLRLRLGVDLTFGTTDGVTVPAAVVQQAAEAVGPLALDLPDNVIVDDGAGGTMVKYPAGAVTIQPGEVVEFLGAHGVGEAELNRSIRLSQLWSALLEGLAATSFAPDGGTDSSGDTELFGQIVEALSAGGVAMQLLPTNELPLLVDPPASIDQIDQAAMATWVPTYVPFPISAFPGQRASVNLLNGTTNPDAIKGVVPKIVGAGGEISLTGNAQAFDIATSSVEYGSEDAKAAADAIAAQLGLAAAKSEEPDDNVDVTVVVGKDLLT
ncbi:MAG: LytR C-terminal domain-containing protein [Microthrixaceae bacterium]